MLKGLRLACASETEASRTAEEGAARDRLTPLDDRLRNLFTTIPPGVQQDSLSLSTHRTMLRDRRRGACHSGELGAALRRQGWMRTRCSRGGDDGGFSALWYPPGAA